jgi:predicted aldo/keto reductase-like oxidoreductase
MHDKGDVHWDFIQIELNYLDWKHAHEINDANTNAEYLYNELTKRGIPAVIMEPLLGGRLSNMPTKLVAELKQRDPEHSVASWAFRYAASQPNVLTLLSGMTYMEHLKDNLLSLCPLKPLTKEEMTFLETDIAKQIVSYNTIPCNDCKYCMPCPYGLDIPGIFVHYNKCLNESNVPQSSKDPDYDKERRAFLIGYDRSVPKLRQADHCIGCGQCAPSCPQHIEIPNELHRISAYVEKLKQGKL